jgi:hypothetical protein
MKKILHNQYFYWGIILIAEIILLILAATGTLENLLK